MLQSDPTGSGHNADHHIGSCAASRVHLHQYRLDLFRSRAASCRVNYCHTALDGGRKHANNRLNGRFTFTQTCAGRYGGCAHPPAQYADSHGSAARNDISRHDAMLARAQSDGRRSTFTSSSVADCTCHLIATYSHAHNTHKRKHLTRELLLFADSPVDECHGNGSPPMPAYQHTQQLPQPPAARQAPHEVCSTATSGAPSPVFASNARMRNRQHFGKWQLRRNELDTADGCSTR